MRVFEQLETSRHEQVVYTYLHDAGLKAIIAIHDTTLGPALGGVRMYPYASEEDALQDVLRLARGMTYKAAAAGLNLGGGKAVIIGDPKKDKSETLFRAFGRAVDALGGRYITAEDVGSDVLDMEYISQETPYVTGIDVTRGGSGDPSPFTAFGVLQGIKASLEWKFGDQSLDGKIVAVQGVGTVGSSLISLLRKGGAQVFAADVDEAALDRLRAQDPEVTIVSPSEILGVKCDVLAPCALGAVINDDTIEALQTQIIAGAANNQLQTLEHGRMLQERGILYAPDYVINAGGLMNVYVELDGYSRQRAFRLIRSIFHNTRRIFELSEKEGLTTAEASDRLAVRRMREIGRLAVCFNKFPRERGHRPPSDETHDIDPLNIDDVAMGRPMEVHR